MYSMQHSPDEQIFTGNIPFVEIVRDSTVMLKIRSGVRPSRPPDSNISWDEWGLTSDIWTLIEDCWKHDPSTRPFVVETLTRLSKNLTQDSDTRPIGGEENTSPARFRDSIGGHSDIQDVTQLEALVFKGQSVSTQSLKQLYLSNHGPSDSLYLRAFHLQIPIN